MRKPNLFLVGAPKAGSTFLWTILKDHKDVFFSTNPEKEINYFSYDELNTHSYYKDYKIKDEKDYYRVFKNGQAFKYIADGSVSYFSYPSIPEKIYKFNPEAKIIFIVRDPILRAFSHYTMDKRMGYAKESFLDYLINKDNKYDKFIHQYIENSLYYKHIYNYLKYFDKKQIFILELENFNNDFDRLCSFLDIQKIDISKKNKKINANKTPRNIISRTLQHNRYLATLLKKFIPKKVVSFFEILLYKKAEKIILTKSERILLEKYINDDYIKFKENYLS